MLETVVNILSGLALVALTYSLVRIVDHRLSFWRQKPELSGIVNVDRKSCYSSVAEVQPTESKLSRRSSPEFEIGISNAMSRYSSDPEGLTKFISGTCETNYDAASALFFKGRQFGLISAVNSSTDLVLRLCIACIKVGSPHFIFKYLAEMDDMKVPRDLNFLSIIIRTLTSRKHFKICLSVNDNYLSLVSPALLCEEGASEAAKTAYSCLLWAASETKEHWRALKFFRQLERSGLDPSDNDIFNVVNACLYREDWKSAAQIIMKYPGSSSKRAVDAAVRTLLSADTHHQLGELIASAPSPATVEHVLKAIAKSDSRVSFFDYVMRRSDTSDSIIELLAECVKGWDMDTPETKLKDILHSGEFSKSGRILTLVNALLSKIRGLSRMVFIGLLGDLRMAVYSSGLRPNLSTYSGLIKLSPTVNDLMDVYNLFGEQQLVDSSLAIHSEFLNTILMHVSAKISTSSEGESAYAFANRVLSDADRYGVGELSENAVSSLVAVLLKCSNSHGIFEEIYGLLSGMRAPMEGRVFLQAIEGAIRQKELRWISDLFQLMTEKCKRTKIGSVERLLKTAASDGRVFAHVLELALLNRFAVKEAIVSKMQGDAKVKAVLVKYKYRLPQ
jgi:hypothetical protein